MDKRDISINQAVTGSGNLTALNLAGGDITSNLSTTQNETKDVLNMLETLRSLIEQSNIDDSEKEIVTDDIETIQEQLNSETPKKTRVKRAIDSLKTFAKKIPTVVGATVGLIEKAPELINGIEEIITKINP